MKKTIDDDGNTVQHDGIRSIVPEPKSPSADHPLNANSLLKNAKKVVNKSYCNKSFEMGSSTCILPCAASSISSHRWYYETLADMSDIEERLHEFASSIFWILERKRLDQASERHDKPVLLMAPFENQGFMGIDTESR